MYECIPIVIEKTHIIIYTFVHLIYASIVFLEIIIYLKEEANLDYSEISLYNITIACIEARTPVEKSSYLAVVVEPNAAPVFNNFQSTTLYHSSVMEYCSLL